MADMAEETLPTAETEGTGAPEAAAGEAMAQETAPAAAQTQEAPAEEGMTSLLDAASTSEDAEQGAPEAYEAFEGENGQKFDPASVQGFSDVAKELGLSQEKAQKLFSAMAPTARDYLQKGLVAQSNEWAKLSQNDPEYGGMNFKRNAGVIRQAYNAYTTPELRAIINGSGLGNHPEVLRMFYRIGKTMQQDTGVTGEASAPSQKRSRYPNSHMVQDL